MSIRLACVGFTALLSLSAFAPHAGAKVWTVGKYQCEDERQVGARAGAAAPTLLGRAVPVVGSDNVAKCLAKCDANANCRTVNIRHTVPTANDATICTLYSDATTQKTVFKSIQGKQWGAVCSKN
jgi:hypothetical protein